MANPTIFISYRRDDSAGDAGRIFDRLAARFGKGSVFRDIDNIAAGDDFMRVVGQRIAETQVFLALIGPRWLSASDGDGRRRLEQENDFVRQEIAGALERKIQVIPVMLSGAPIPRAEDLPAPLAPLLRCSAFELREESFDQDVARLMDQFHLPRRRRRPPVLVAGAVAGAAVVLAAAIGGHLWRERRANGPGRALGQRAETGVAVSDQAPAAEPAKASDPAAAVEPPPAAGVEPGGSGQADRVTPLALAARAGRLATVKTLIARGADPGPALAWAAGAEQRQVFDYLLSRSPPPGRKDLGDALFAAARHSTALSQILLDHGADPNAREPEYGRTPLDGAADVAALTTVQLLLARGADPNAKDSQSWSPLHFAIHIEGDEPARLQIADALLARGADIEARTKSMIDWQPTPLLLAIWADKPGMALRLIERGANPNAASKSPGPERTMTALMWAAMKNAPDVVKALLAKGAVADARNDHGETALMFASRSLADSRPAMQLLLNAGAQVDRATPGGWTALMYALHARQDDNVRFLRAHGARRATLHP